MIQTKDYCYKEGRGCNLYYRKKIKNPFKRFWLLITGKNKWQQITPIKYVDSLSEVEE